MAVIIIAFISFSDDDPSGIPSSASPVEMSGDVHVVRTWDAGQFYTAVDNAKPDATVQPHAIRGGINPHHMVARSLIADWFATLGTTEVERMVVLGPDHFGRSPTPFMTSAQDWRTPVGPVRAAGGAARSLAADNEMVSLQPEAMEREHAINALMPFIQYYLPHTRVIPVAVRQDASREDLDALVRDLTRLDEGRTVFLVSADMAHHQSAPDAMRRDRTTLRLLRDANADALRSLGSLHTDSGESLYVLLQLLDPKTVTMHTLAHTNASRLLNRPHVEATSYISSVFY